MFKVDEFDNEIKVAHLKVDWYSFLPEVALLTICIRSSTDSTIYFFPDGQLWRLGVNFGSLVSL